MRKVTTDRDAEAYVMDTLSGSGLGTFGVSRDLLLELRDAAGSWEAIQAMEHDRYWEIVEAHYTRGYRG